jgi:DNA-directed RNA polymerase specialized sigma24 family protein
VNATANNEVGLMNRQQVFEGVVDDHYEALSSYAHSLLGEKQDVEDVVHQAFMLTFERLADGLPFEGEPARWLRGCVAKPSARNVAKKEETAAGRGGYPAAGP